MLFLIPSLSSNWCFCMESGDAQNIDCFDGKFTEFLNVEFALFPAEVLKNASDKKPLLFVWVRLNNSSDSVVSRLRNCCLHFFYYLAWFSIFYFILTSFSIFLLSKNVRLAPSGDLHFSILLKDYFGIFSFLICSLNN